MPRPSVITEEFKAIQTALEALEPLDEKQRQFAVTMILSRLGMAGAPTTPKPGNVGAGGGSNGHASAGAGRTGVEGRSAKEFLKMKNPTTDLERLTCLAYYLANAMDTPSFTTRDITKLNGEAGGSNFSNAAATANNGVSQSKFLSRAGGGKKKITNLGEAVVDALPDRAKVMEVVTTAPHRSKGKRKRKAKVKAKS